MSAAADKAEESVKMLREYAGQVEDGMRSDPELALLLVGDALATSLLALHDLFANHVIYTQDASRV